MEYHFATNSPSETRQYSRRLAELLEGGDVILLSGDLGAGKTQFVKGISEGLNSKETVRSPSFVIIRQHTGDLNLFHIDLYRLKTQEIGELGLEEYLDGDGVVVVEWGEKIGKEMLDDYLFIEIKRTESETGRDFKVKSRGKSWEEKVKRWLR